MNNLRIMRFAVAAVVALTAFVTASAQKYQNGLIDKTVAVIGNEVIMLSDIEEEIKNQQMGGFMSDKSGRCEALENMMVSKLFLMQARVDSIEVNTDMVESNLNEYMANILTYYGGEEGVEKQYGKTTYKLRQQLRKDLEDRTLAQQMQQEVAQKINELTPYDVQQYVDKTDPADLPMVMLQLAFDT